MTKKLVVVVFVAVSAVVVVAVKKCCFQFFPYAYPLLCNVREDLATTKIILLTDYHLGKFILFLLGH